MLKETETFKKHSLLSVCVCVVEIFLKLYNKNRNLEFRRKDYPN